MTDWSQMMNHKPWMKKLLLVSVVLVCAVMLSGCRVPTDESGAIKQITESTTFSQIMSDENWFSALFVWPLAWLINNLATKTGVIAAISLTTILVNAVLLVITLPSQIGMQKMQMLQPELEKIQRKYEGRDDDASRMRMAQEMQNLYSKYKVNPMGTMVVQFIQFPIIIAMYQAVQRASSVRTATVGSMSLDTTIWAGIQSSGRWGYIFLFVIMAVLQYLSMNLPMWINKKKAEAEAAKHHRKPQEPTSNTQTKIMQWYMFALILVFGLMWPAAMSVYWAIYSAVTIVKTLIVQKVIDSRNAKEAEGK